MSDTEMNRRNFLRSVGTGVAGLTAASAFPSVAHGQNSRTSRPNVVFIMADDMGFSDIGCYGGEIDTPNIDELADEGLRFSQFYNAARCCPTRASALTGVYPHQAGMGFMMSEGDDLGLPGYRSHLNDSCVTIAEVLGRAGYNTAMSGKWHLGTERPHWPTNRGFDHFSGILEGSSDYFDPGKGALGFSRNERVDLGGEDFYMTDYISDEAVRYVEQMGEKDDPFFLYLPYTAPHWPIQAPEAMIQKYEGRYMDGWDVLREQRYARQKEMGLFSRTDWSLSPRDSGVPPWDEVGNKQRWDRKMATYAAMIEVMDQGIGRVMRTLERLGIADNTLVLFISDNGACAETAGRGSEAVPGTPESFVGYHLPWANVSNTPFRLYKHWVHEGGISTPLIAHWPDGLEAEPGSITHEVGHIVDIMATAVDVADASYPGMHDGRSITSLEGESLVPLLKGRSRPGHSMLFWEHEGNRAVRQGRWKITSRSHITWQLRTQYSYTGPFKPNDVRWSLYDMEADRTELNDLALEYPEKVSELARQYHRWADQVGVIPWRDYMARTDIGWLKNVQKIEPPQQ